MKRPIPKLPADDTVERLRAAGERQATAHERMADALERIAKAAERLAGTEYRGAILTHRRGA